MVLYRHRSPPSQAALVTATDVDSDGISLEDTSGLSTSLPVFREGETFTTKSFTEAGWKQNKECDTLTIPESPEIWYGFFQPEKYRAKTL